MASITIKELQANQKLIDFVTKTNNEYFKTPICHLYHKYGGSENETIDLEQGRFNKIDPNDCVCGRSEDKHKPVRPKSHKFTSSPTSWSLQQNTHYPLNSFCTAFGEMIFEDADCPEVEGARSKYIRLQGFVGNSNAEERYKAGYKEALKTLILGKECWDVPEPCLIIEVTGTAVDKDVEKSDYHAIETLKAGLVQAAREASAWIVSGGSNVGIMRLIGDEVARYHRLDINIPCIGFASWGMVKNREMLIHSQNELDNLTLTAHYKVEHPQPEKGTNISTSSGTYLNHGHNYFILVDNGRENIFGEEITLRHELIHFLGEQVGKTSSTKMPVPIVMLAVGGGSGTLTTFERCFGVTNKDITTPVVILYGFGGATDLLADIYNQEFTKSDNNSSQSEHSIREKIKTYDSFSRLLDNAHKNKSPDVIKAEMEAMSKRVWLCLQKAKEGNLLTIVNEFDPQTLSSAILQTAMRHHTPIMTLQLARLWDAPDAAEQLLKDNIAEIKQEKTIRKLVRQAVAMGQVDFLTLLMNYKLIQHNDYLSPNDICSIYKKVLFQGEGNSERGANEKKLLNTISKSTKDDGWKRFQKLGEIFAEETGCFLLNFFQEGNRYEQSPSKQQPGLAGGEVKNDVLETQPDDDSRRKQRLSANYRDVFFLQLALNQHDMAIHLWENGSELIGTALIASIFLHGLSELAKAKNRHSLSKTYETHARNWEERAKKILHKCDEFRQHKVTWLLNRKLQTWQGRSVFEIAFYGKCREFVEHPAVQKKLTHIWYGRISSITPSYLVYVTALFPFTLWLWLGFGLLKFIPLDSSGKLVAKNLAKSILDVKKEAEKSMIKANRVDIAYNKTTPNAVEIGESAHSRPSSVPSKAYNFIRRHIFRPIKAVYSSTMVRFFGQILFTFFFLMLFTSFILSATLNPNGVTLHEGFVLAWSICVLLDILHETYADDIAVVTRMKTIPLSARIKVFFNTAVIDRFKIFNWEKADYYNAIIPAVTGVLLLVSFILRMTLNPVYFIYPRTTYVLTCLFFWIRSMRVFNVSRSIGIIVTILSELLPTLFHFLLVYIFLLFAFSIPIYALISPVNANYSNNETDGTQIFSSNWMYKSSYSGGAQDFARLVTKVVYNRWWNLVQFDLDNSRKAVEGVCLSTGENEEAPITALPTSSSDCADEFNFVAIALYIVFVFLTNIAWMNVLIATLSEKVGDIWQEADKLSKFNYLVSVRSVYYRCIFPAPISTIEIFFRIIHFFLVKAKRPSSKDVDFLDDNYRTDALLKLDELERYCAKEVFADQADAGQHFTTKQGTPLHCGQCNRCGRCEECDQIKRCGHCKKCLTSSKHQPQI